eukprot:GHRQ01005987.1.p1 GENE.GHRQ01005987.1~~GHRQ01005987.1.p1  ORF type:complete len:367 (+),score=182.69 GHRQ01005987.1:259-1359(+)
MLQAGSRLTASQAPTAALCPARHSTARRPFSASPVPPQQHRHASAAAAATAHRRQLLGAPLLLPFVAGRGRAVVMAAAADSHDLLIVGPGVLGSFMGTLWKQQYPTATVTAQTNTESNHERLRKMGLQPVTREAAPAGKQYPYVLFAAPPSGSDDYPAAVRAATRQWDGSGSFVFTSSMSVCATEDGSEVSENCPLVPQGKAAGTDKLLGAEAATLEAGGNVLRLVGLYHAARGPHTFFIKMGEVARYSGYVVNMLHYEDAARIALAVLRGDGSEGGSGFRGQVFVGADGAPLTFQEMVDACFASGLFTGSVKFTGTPDATPGGKGKVVNNAATRAKLGGWSPKYPSFQQFFKDGGKDYYSTSGLF